MEIYKLGIFDDPTLKDHILAVKFSGEREGIVAYSNDPSVYEEDDKVSYFIPHTDSEEWRDPETYEEWFYFLQEPCRTEAIAALKGKKEKTRSRTLAEAVHGGFTWSDTPQDHTYWHNIYKSLLTNKQIETKTKMQALTVTKNSPALSGLIEEIATGRTDNACFDGTADYISFCEDDDNEISFLEEDDLDDFEITKVSRAEFIKLIEAIPEEEEAEQKEEFSWNEYECYVTPGHIQVGCQSISESDVSKMEALIAKHSNEYSEEVYLDNGSTLSVCAPCLDEINVDFNGGDDTISLDVIRDLINEIREAQERLS